MSAVKATPHHKAMVLDLCRRLIDSGHQLMVSGPTDDDLTTTNIHVLEGQLFKGPNDILLIWRGDEPEPVGVVTILYNSDISPFAACSGGFGYLIEDVEEAHKEKVPVTPTNLELWRRAWAAETIHALKRHLNCGWRVLDRDDLARAAVTAQHYHGVDLRDACEALCQAERRPEETEFLFQAADRYVVKH